MHLLWVFFIFNDGISSLKMDLSIYLWKDLCVYVSWVGVEDAEGDYIYLFAGSASHGWVPWFLPARVSICNLDSSELVRYLWTYKNDRMVAELF